MRQVMRSPWLWLLRVIGLIVPRRLRPDWRREWEAELRWREGQLAEWDKLDWHHKLALLWYSAGAFADALWLQPRRWEDEMIQDLRFGVRMLARHPGFTFIAVLTLALGVGANTAIFSVVNAVLLRPLPYPQPGQLVRVFETNRTMSESTISPPNFLDWQAQQTVFERLAAFQHSLFDLAGREGVEQIAGLRVSADFFPLLGVQAARGRTFLPEEDQPVGPHVVVLGHKFWLERLGGDVEAVGRTLTFGSQSYTIIGVLPPDFEFISPATELWAPLRLGDEGHRMRRTERYLQAVARLRPGVPLRQAQVAMDGVAARLAQQYPDANASSGARLVPLQEHLFGKLRDSLLVLMGAVGFVLLIACANLANLLLARAAAREKEFAVRAALGAGRWRVVRQLLTESACLSLMGAAAGLLLARAGVPLLLSLWQQSSGPSALAIARVNRIGLDAGVLGFTLLVALLTGLIFGLVPAWQAARIDLVEPGRQGASAAWSGRRLRGALVVSEIALALVLLVGAGLMINSLWRLGRVKPGFDPDRLLTLQVAMPAARSTGNRDEAGRKVTAFFRELTERVRLVPGVVAADVITAGPLVGEGSLTRFTIENRPPASPADVPMAAYRVPGPDYFRAMGIPLLQGRPFTDADTPQAPAVIINETLAKRFWPNENPMGRRVRRGGLDSTGSWMTVVGVVADVRTFGLDEAPRPELYLPHAQFPLPEVTLVVRGADDPLKLVNALRAQILMVDRHTRVTGVRPLAELLAHSVSARRFNMQLLLIFAALALALAGVGVYGVMSYAITQRTHELGIRVALGAQPRDVLRLVLGQGLSLTLLGIAIGLLAALALTRSMKSLLYEVSAADPLTLGMVTLLLAAVALLACFIPARRATQVDPLIALRHE